MTNSDIILTAMLLNNLDPNTVEVDTYTGWKRKGFSVNKGEKAIFAERIWKPVKVEIKDKDGNGTGEYERKLVLVPASFFRKEQVKKLQTA